MGKGMAKKSGCAVEGDWGQGFPNFRFCKLCKE